MNANHSRKTGTICIQPGNNILDSTLCQADFTYVIGNSLIVDFQDESTPAPISWQWDFGDGSASFEPLPVHQYAGPGPYDVCLTIETADGCVSTYCEPIIVEDTIVNPNCQAMYSWLPGGEPNSIMFMDESTPAPISWQWDFGDGSTSFEPLPVHQYAGPGPYDVCLTIETADGCVSTYCEPIIVEDTIVNPNCQAMYSWLPDGEPNSIMFMDESTPAPISWQWDFGDGSTSFEPLPVHQYAGPGPYDVCLTIETADGCVSTYCEPIIVEDTIVNPNCQAMYSWLPGGEPNSIMFMDESTPAPISWQWDFGDGSTSFEPLPVHQYAGPGPYDVCLTIETADGCVSTYCEPIIVEDTIVNPNCQAMYSWLPGGEPNSIMFMDESTPAPISWQWDFGDGSTSFEPLPVHQYAGPGPYDVCLTIETADGCVSTYCEPIIVEDTIVNPNCQAMYSWLPGGEPNSIMFMDESTPAPITWHWDFGDGNTSFEPLPMHQYAAPGLYDVCLTIETADSCVSTYCEPIIVEDTIPQNNCEAQYMYYIQNDGQTVQFIDGSSGELVNWFWDFGDGTSSTEQFPIHTFSNAGSYNVCLTVYGADSCIDQYCNSIVINSNPVDSVYNIYGEVHAGNELLSSGMVLLFNTDYVYYNAYDYYLIDNGSFEFTEVNAGNYIIYAIPNPILYPDFFPTYYGDVVFWEDAYILNINANTYDLDIHLVPMDSTFDGDGTIGGTVTFNDNVTYEENIFGFDWFNGGKGQTGFNAMNIPVVLKNANGDPLTYALSDENGHYEFANLNYQGYTINAEKASLEAVSPVVEVSSSSSSYSNVDILIGTQNIVTSVDENITNANINEVVLYPNPVNNELTLEFNLLESDKLNISVVSIAGQILISENIEETSGHQTINLDVSGLSSGIYFIKIDQNNSNAAFVKFVK